jgi:hypothetical protein
MNSDFITRTALVALHFIENGRNLFVTREDKWAVIETAVKRNTSKIDSNKFELIKELVTAFLRLNPGDEKYKEYTVATSALKNCVKDKIEFIKGETYTGVVKLNEFKHTEVAYGVVTTSLKCQDINGNYVNFGFTKAVSKVEPTVGEFFKVSSKIKWTPGANSNFCSLMGRGLTIEKLKNSDNANIEYNSPTNDEIGIYLIELI